MKNYKYRPRNKEEYASLIASRFPVSASRDPENAGLDNDAIHNKLYSVLIRKNLDELQKMYYNENLIYESIRCPIKHKRTDLEKVAKSSEFDKSLSHVETLRNCFGNLSKICGDCFEPSYNSISKIKDTIELELRRLKHVNKALHETWVAEYEMFREQYPVLKEDGSNEFKLSG